MVGGYAQRWSWPETRERAMTVVVSDWRRYLPHAIPLPHPSWRNTAWLKRNPWFEDEVSPYLRLRVAELLAA
jgi:uracil-DNA glycosylase